MMSIYGVWVSLAHIDKLNITEIQRFVFVSGNPPGPVAFLVHFAEDQVFLEWVAWKGVSGLSRDAGTPGRAIF